jgi:uncharacterized membrane protein YkvA (DUF1232 family)
MIQKKRRIRPWMFRKEMIILYYALKDSRTPLRAKLPAIISLLYLFSPVDLIPDIVPFFGYLDDIVIVPLLLNLSIRLLPDHIKEEYLSRAAGSRKKIKMYIFLFILFVISWVVVVFLVTKKSVGST